MKNKKILIIGSNDGFSLEKMYFRGFKSLGCNITFLHAYSIQKNFINKFIWKYLRFVIFKLIKNKITRHIVSNKKFYDLIIIFKGIEQHSLFLQVLNIRKIRKNPFYKRSQADSWSACVQCVHFVRSTSRN